MALSVGVAVAVAVAVVLFLFLCYYPDTSRDSVVCGILADLLVEVTGGRPQSGAWCVLFRLNSNKCC